MRLLRFIRICVNAGVRLFKEGYTYRASALAFTTVLSLVPLLSVIVTFLTIFPIFTQFSLHARDYIVANFVHTSGKIVEQYLEAFTQHASQLPMISILFLLVTAFTLLITVEHTVNEIWQRRIPIKNWVTLLSHWTILIVAPLGVALSIFLSSYLFSMALFKPAYNLGLKIHLLNYLPIVINTLVFGILYHVLPNYRIHWRQSLTGGIMAAILLEIANKTFAFYIEQFHSYEIIYGALAIIPLFLTWIYIFWLIILYGAIVVFNLTKNAE